MRVSSIVGVIGTVVLAATLGCGPKPETISPTTSSFHECKIRWPVEESPDTVTIALFDEVDPRDAPQWHNDAERLVFNQLYEPLLGTQCEDGTRRRGIVDEFTVDSRGAVLRLRNDARFWDGTPVTARDVVECFDNGVVGEVAIDSLVAIDDGVVVVHASPETDWSILSSPAFSIVRETGAPWPMGTGRYRVVEDAITTGHVLMLPAFDTGESILRFIDRRGTDPRDLLDSSMEPMVDLMTVVCSSELIMYGQRSDRFKAMLFIAPTRAYVLIAPGRLNALRHGELVPELAASLSSALAADAVRSARAAAIDEPLWWEADSTHTLSLDAPFAIGAAQRRVVFDASDAIARDLAERLVSLATTRQTSGDALALAAAVPGIVDQSRPLVAFGARDREFAELLSRGADIAYVLAAPFDTPDPLRAAVDLRHSMPWLGRTSLRDALVPLVSTRELAIVMNHRIGVTSDRYGNVFIVGSSTIQQQ